MANAIELAKSYVPLLDEVYAREVLTSDLDGAPELVQQGGQRQRADHPHDGHAGPGRLQP
jgi:hypothetical protein